MDIDIKKLQKRFRYLLFPASLPYAFGLYVKNSLYDKGILKSKKYDNIKIISVGNIAVGGVGKTPVVIELAKALKGYGRVCVICGNYPLKDKRVNVVSIDNAIFKKPPYVNDESYMIAKKTLCSVISSKNRLAAIELAIGLKMDYVILDDGLHKRDIKKDLDICVVDKRDPYEDGFYLPAGMLRDSKSSLNRCDITVCVDKYNTEEKKNGCYEAKIKSLGIFNKNGKVQNVKSAFLFCGIGKPEGFVKSVENLGIKITGYKFYDDHHIYDKKDIEYVEKRASESSADIMLTTYKDFVKIEDSSVCYLDIDFKIEKFNDIIKKIVGKL